MYVSGNVGIGTTGPLSKLHIVGSGSDIAYFTTMGGIQLANGYNDGTWGVRIAGIDNGVTGHDLRIQTRNTNNGAFVNSVAVTSSGNVGIGTTGPGAKLEINQPSGTYDFANPYQKFTYGAVEMGRVYMNSRWDYVLDTTQNGDRGNINLTPKTNVIVTQGNVGIGTASPGGKLDINNGFIKFSTAGVSAPAQSATSSGSKLVLYDGNLNHEIGLESGGMWFKADGQFTFYDNAGPTPRVTIKAGGNVGIGTVAPAAGLEVNSAATDVVSFHNAVGTGLKLIGGQTTWTVLSDARLKDTLGSIKDATQKLLALHPVYYRLKIDKKNTPHRFGLIAQDVQKVFPEVVDVDAKGYLGLRYTELTPLLIAGFQEQESRMQKDENQLKVQDKEIKALKAKNAQLEARIVKLESRPQTVPSDKRLKKNITPFSDGLNVINQLNPVHYEYNGKTGLFKDSPAIGVVAQDIKDIAPYTVSTYRAKLEPQDKEEILLFSINSEPLTFVLINAVKELNSQLQKAQADIAYLKQELVGATAMQLKATQTLTTQTEQLKTQTKEIQEIRAELVSKLKEIMKGQK